jgi:hypothetical protein
VSFSIKVNSGQAWYYVDSRGAFLYYRPSLEGPATAEIVLDRKRLETMLRKVKAERSKNDANQRRRAVGKRAG